VMLEGIKSCSEIERHDEIREGGAINEIGR
jgi:hypothetical protein